MPSPGSNETAHVRADVTTNGLEMIYCRSEEFRRFTRSVISGVRKCNRDRGLLSIVSQKKDEKTVSKPCIILKTKSQKLSFSVSKVFYSVSIYIFISFLKSYVLYYRHKNNSIRFEEAVDCSHGRNRR